MANTTVRAAKGKSRVDGQLIANGSGTLYGVTEGGGTFGQGTVYRIFLH